MADPVFVVGAGFNRDANSEVAPVDSYVNTGYHAAYPLVNDLAAICFKRPLASGESIEKRFESVLRHFNDEPVPLAASPSLYAAKPIERLIDTLKEADFRVGQCLLPLDDKEGERCRQLGWAFPPKWSRPANCYRTFFDRFHTSSFITFNYDGLVELFLMQMQRWFPLDGYGVPVEVGGGDLPAATHSSSLVLHLHGSIYVYTSDFEIENEPAKPLSLYPKKEHEYRFDPGRNPGLFLSYPRAPLQVGDDRSNARRIIAPLPDKTEGLKSQFVTKVYSRARKLLSGATKIVAIGYDFNPHDEISYRQLLKAVSDTAKFLLVCPNATEICNRLRDCCPRIEFQPITATLKQWVEAGFPGSD